MRKVIMMGVILGLAFVISGCDNPALTLAQIGDNATISFSAPAHSIPPPMMPDGTAMPASIACWDYTASMTRHTWTEGDLYQVNHYVAWCEDGTKVTSILDDSCSWVNKDETFSIQGSGGIHAHGCSATPPNGVTLGSSVAYVNGYWTFSYSIFNTPNWIDLKWFNPYTHLKVHAHVGTSAARIDGYGRNG